MKPGQPIEIASEAHPTPSPIQGHVALVADGEVVIQLDAPSRAQFAARSPLDLSYRDEAGEHRLRARVMGMQGTERLIVAVASEGGGPSPGDARRNVRVEHLLRMEYHGLAPEEIDEARAAVLDGPRILKYERHPAPPLQVAGAENEPLEPGWSDSPADERLARIERKLDQLLERLGIEVASSNERPYLNVSLSARGLRFRDFQRRCQTGDMVYVCFELPLNPTVEVRAIAETLHVVEDLKQWDLSAGRDVVLEFRVIKDESRALIERYCQQYRPLRHTA